MEKFKVLIPLNIPREPIDRILHDCEIIYPPVENFSDDEMERLIVNCHALVAVFGNRVSDQLLAKAPELKIIANYGAGYDHVNVGAATALKIAVSNSPTPVTEPTAELALALMLDLSRNISSFNEILHQGNQITWGTMYNLSKSLYGKKLGVIGMGAIGKALARKAIACGMQVTYHNRNRLSIEVEKHLQVQFVEKEKLLADSDFVSLHVPLNQQTRGLIGSNELWMMKPSAYLINTARGAVVDEAALLEALEKKVIAGAGLDVYIDEPRINERFMKLGNAILTPHVGSATIETRDLMSEEVALNIRDFIDGRVPRNLVNREVLNL